jgi:hypothetical protein
MSISQRQSDNNGESTEFGLIKITNPLKGLEIALSSLDFQQSSSTFYNYSEPASKSEYKLSFDLTSTLPLEPLLTSRVSAQERHFRFDFSGHNLPLKPKKFSFFKSAPLYSFYELVSLSPTLPAPHGSSKPADSLVLWESDISKIVSCDPFWTVTDPLPLSLLQPRFRLNIY